MSRKETIIEIQDDTQILTFKIRKMSAAKLESWAYRAGALLAASGIPVTGGGLLGTARSILEGKDIAALGKLDIDQAMPLLDELLACCSRVVENVEERCTPESMGYVENVTTMFTLRKAAASLNLESFMGGTGAA